MLHRPKLRCKISGILVKNQSEKIQRGTFQYIKYFSIVFLWHIWHQSVRKKSLAEVLLIILLKKYRCSKRLNNSSKTFLNQVNQWIFVNYKAKKTRNFWDEAKTQKHHYITYEPSSFFIDFSTGELCLQLCKNKTEKGRKWKSKTIAKIIYKTFVDFFTF